MTESADPVRLLLDEMFTPRIAEALRTLSIDCRAVAEDPVLRALDDADILDVALSEGRAVVTNNVADFELLRRQRIADQRPVPDLIYTSDHAFPRDRRFVQRLIDALAAATEAGLAQRYGGLYWLAAVDQQ